tara:strand:- start:2394 stop:2819 length:426 start_codon:yes stop_codon:yes gene_type:complete
MEHQNGKATVVVTYNSVNDHPAGTYQGKNGPVVINSHENTRTWGADDAEGKLGQILHGLFGRIDSEDVDKIYLYVGANAKDGALRAAKQIAGEGNKLSLVACDCYANEKSAVAERIGAPIIWGECGGRKTLQRIVDRELAE